MQPHENNRILDLLEKINEKIDAQSPRFEPLSQSQDTSLIDVALAKAQGEFTVVGFNAQNPFFKSRYAKLDAILGMALPILSKHGIAFLQREYKLPSGAIWLITQIRHQGQWMESKVFIKLDKEGIQEYGKAISFHKRYSVMAILGITCSDDPDDDDGEELMKPVRYKEEEETGRRIVPEKVRTSGQRITAEHVDELQRALYSRPDAAEELFKGYKVKKFEELLEQDYHEIVKLVKSYLQKNPYIPNR